MPPKKPNKGKKEYTGNFGFTPMTFGTPTNQAAHNAAVAEMGGLPGVYPPGSLNAAAAAAAPFQMGGPVGPLHTVFGLPNSTIHANVARMTGAAAPTVALAMGSGSASSNAALSAAAMNESPAAGAGPALTKKTGRRYPPMTQTRVTAGLQLMEMLVNRNHSPELRNHLIYTIEELFQTSPEQIKQFKDKATSLLATLRSPPITEILKDYQRLNSANVIRKYSS
jgi:hypothetical protein